MDPVMYVAIINALATTLPGLLSTFISWANSSGNAPTSEEILALNTLLKEHGADYFPVNSTPVTATVTVNPQVAK